MEVILAVLLFFEWQRQRIRLPFAMALGFFVAMHVFLTPIKNSPRFAPAIIAAAIRLPTGDAGYLWALPLINALSDTRDDLLISEIQAACDPRSLQTRVQDYGQRRAAMYEKMPRTKEISI